MIVTRVIVYEGEKDWIKHVLEKSLLKRESWFELAKGSIKMIREQITDDDMNAVEEWERYKKGEVDG